LRRVFEVLAIIGVALETAKVVAGVDLQPATILVEPPFFNFKT
jgi:hypothetical protein